MSDRIQVKSYSGAFLSETFEIREPAPVLSSTAVLNRGLRVHDWYLMPESYSEPLVSDAVKRFGIDKNDTILDPFSGTGTSVITAVMNGINGIGLEVNPFLCFASRVKLKWNIDLSALKDSMDDILGEAEPLLKSMSSEKDLFTISLPIHVSDRARAILSELEEPQMPRLYQWMSPAVVKKVLLLRHLIEQKTPDHVRSHFLLALASTLRPCSNMKLAPHAFGSCIVRHDAPVFEVFSTKIRKIHDDLEFLQSTESMIGRSELVQCDARISDSIRSELLPASLAITSPPYLNNLDYTMQTRMELFFLKFLNGMKELRDLRKSMLICDAKAMYRDIRDSEEVKQIQSIQKIARRLKEVHQGKNWGWDYAFMTTQYFGGMLRVLKSIKTLLKRGARFVLIVGESAHSGVKIPLPDILAELGQKAGYRFEAINVLRRRRSSSHTYELCESEVILRKK